MLIGNRERFALELTPVSPSWEPRYEPEAAAWAQERVEQLYGR